MKEICAHIKGNVAQVLVEWEQLVKEEPWFSLPPEHRIDSLPDVIVGLVEAALCDPVDHRAHKLNIDAACQHGSHRRKQQIPEHLIFTEYHLLRQAIWRFLTSQLRPSDRITQAMLRIDSALTLATNASMWGYYREEIEALGKWEEGMARIAASSPFLQTEQEARQKEEES
jgi:hypothetical protein